MNESPASLLANKLFKTDDRPGAPLTLSDDIFWSWDIATGSISSTSYFYSQEIGNDGQTPNFNIDDLARSIHREDSNAVITELERLKRGEIKQVRVDCRLNGETQTAKWIRIKAQREFPSTTNNTDRIVGIFSDITQWKLTEEKNLFHAAILDAIDESAIATDIEGNITYVNRAAENLYGWEARHVIGRNIIDAIVPHISQTQAIEIMARLSEGKSWTGEFLVERNDGSTFLAQVHDAPILDNQGQLAGIIGLSYDITERKQSEEQFRQVIESAPNSIIIVDENGLITLSNSETTTLLGYSKDELVGCSIDILLPMEYRANHQAKIQDYLSNNPARRIVGDGRDIYARHKNGHNIPVEVALSPMRTVKGLYIIATVIDISERKRQEKERLEMREQLAQTSKMESIGHITAGVAHDFNNILGAILGYSELAQLKLASGKTDDIRRYLEVILKSGARAKELIRQMLTFARSSPDEKDKRTPVIELRSAFNEITTLLRSSIPRTIELVFETDDNELYARVQPIHLHQIFVNLVVNARDSIGEYGTIKVALSKQHFKETRCHACKMAFSGDYARVSISDTGSGIAAEIRDKIFVPFFTTKGIGAGTGMGLSVVHGLVHTQNGHILIHSEVGNGTTFDILLPLVQIATPELEVETPESNLDIHDIRILLVDDEPDVATPIREYLTENGAHVTTYYDANEAYMAFSRTPDAFDLVITDETMPNLSGSSLSQKMLKRKPNLPIILCTGFSEHASPEIAKQNGILGFLYKPVDLRTLMNRIQTLLDRPQSKKGDIENI